MAQNDVTTNAYFTMIASDLPACSKAMEGEKLERARGALGELLREYGSSIGQQKPIEEVDRAGVLGVMLSKSGRSILDHDQGSFAMLKMLQDSLLGDACVPTIMLPSISLKICDAGMVSIEEQNRQHQAERMRTVAIKDESMALYIGAAEGRGGRAPVLEVSVPGICRLGEEAPKLLLTRIGYTSVELTVHSLDGEIKAMPSDSIEDVSSELLDALFKVTLPEAKALKRKPLGPSRSNVFPDFQFAWLRLMADVLRLQTIGTATSAEPLPSMRPFAVDQIQVFTPWEPMQISQRGIRYVARMNPSFGINLCMLDPHHEELSTLRGNSRIYIGETAPSAQCPALLALAACARCLRSLLALAACACRHELMSPFQISASAASRSSERMTRREETFRGAAQFMASTTQRLARRAVTTSVALSPIYGSMLVTTQSRHPADRLLSSEKQFAMSRCGWSAPHAPVAAILTRKLTLGRAQSATHFSRK